MIVQNVNLYLGDRGFNPTIRVSQFDTLWQWKFTLYLDDQIWTIPTGATASLNGLKPDGNVFAFAGTISGNIVTVNANVQMTAVAGPVVCELSIASSGKVVGTANFIMDVEKAPKSPDDISSESTIPAYADVIRIAAGIPNNIPGMIETWLDTNIKPIDPTITPIIDKNLEVSGAAADAEAAGKNVLRYREAITAGKNIDTYVKYGIYYIGAIQNLTGDIPSGLTGRATLFVVGGSDQATYGANQIIISRPSNRVCIRSGNSVTVTYDPVTEEPLSATGWGAWNNNIIDDTLSKTGIAADAKATGDAILEMASTLRDEIADLNNSIYDSAYAVGSGSGKTVQIDDCAGDIPYSSVQLMIIPRQDITDTDTPSPSQIFKISGFNTARIFKSGKNLADYTAATSSTAIITLLHDRYGFNIKTTESKTYAGANIANMCMKAGKTYTLSADAHIISGSQNQISMRFRSTRTTNGISSGTILAAHYINEDGHHKVTYTPKYDAYVQVAFFVTANTATTGEAEFYNIQLEEGNIDSEFEPYYGNRDTVSWQNEAGIIYGGNVDLQSGDIVVDKGYLELTGEESNWTITDAGSFKCTNILSVDDAASGGTESSVYASSHFASNLIADTPCVYFGTSGQVIFISYHGMEQNIDSWKQYLKDQKAAGTPVQVVYNRANPQQYSISPVTVKALPGRNDICSNVGDISITSRLNTNSLKTDIDNIINDIDLGDADFDKNGLTYQDTSVAWWQILAAAQQIHLAIIEQPEDATVVVNKTATFSVVAYSTTEISYSWQWFNTSGEWKDQSYESFHRATLLVNATQARNGYKYRCAVTDEEGNTVISNPVTLTVVEE